MTGMKLFIVKDRSARAKMGCAIPYSRFRTSVLPSQRFGGSLAFSLHIQFFDNLGHNSAWFFYDLHSDCSLRFFQILKLAPQNAFRGEVSMTLSQSFANKFVIAF